MKLSLSREDMLAIQAIYAEWKREPTDVELEVIAQTWSEHCKHRIFGAKIEHTLDGQRRRRGRPFQDLHPRRHAAHFRQEAGLRAQRLPRQRGLHQAR
jgi:phosphoribosylformylglycinamidine (FGAM) synthase-like enzyme